MSINTYEQNRILSAGPVELVRILYTGAGCAVRNARESLRSGDIASRSREIGKAQAILLELATSVDVSAAGELGMRLLNLYDYMQTRLLEANTRQIDAPLAEVGKLLAVLQEGWQKCPEVQERELAVAS